MRKFMFCFALLCILSCSKDGSQFSEADLIGCWCHDIENQEPQSEYTYLLSTCDGDEVSNYEYRYSLILDVDNIGSEYQLSALDAHSYENIAWTLEGKVLLIENEFGKTSYLIDNFEGESFTLTRQ